VTRSKNRSLSQNSHVYGRQRSSPSNPIFPTIEHTHTHTTCTNTVQQTQHIKTYIITVLPPVDCRGIMASYHLSAVHSLRDSHLCNQGSHYILVLKFKDFSRTLKLHFQGAILDESLQHGQYYSNT